MLKKEDIASSKLDKTDWKYKDEWRRQRMAKFTSSMKYTLMGDKFINTGSVAYIYEKVGEEVSGIPAGQEIDTWATRWGLEHENTAIKKAAERLGVDFLVTQSLIAPQGSRFGGTPDFIRTLREVENGYQVETGEVKCYPSYPHFIECVLCETPQDLLKVDKKLFWQVLDQMVLCGAIVGWAVLYHPDFKAGGFRMIKFRAVELQKEIVLLKERNIMAERKFNEIWHKLLNMEN